MLYYITNFYNVDVNCNGIIGENIVGLNRKNLENDVDYAYIIGNCLANLTKSLSIKSCCNLSLLSLSTTWDLKAFIISAVVLSSALTLKRSSI